MGWFLWSKTASANATIDPSINWAEGQSPSSVNDSARAMMAAAASWRDDISGTLTTGGIGTAYTLATNQGFDSLAHMNGAMIAIIPHTTNTGAVTLAVDGLAPKPIRSQTGTDGNLGAGTLVQGTPYVVSYFNVVGEFILQGFAAAATSVPIGSLLFHTASTPPGSNFIFPIGQEISRTTYATYFAMVGTDYGAGSGGVTFNVPDLRSRFLLPWATMGGSDPGRVTTGGSGIDGATIGAVGGAQNITLDVSMIPSHAHSPPTDSGHTHPFGNNINIGAAAIAGGQSVLKLSTDFGLTTGPNSPLGLSNTGSIGGSGAHNNMPPSMVMPMILRVL